jgi:hypothetical protein
MYEVAQEKSQTQDIVAGLAAIRYRKPIGLRQFGAREPQYFDRMTVQSAPARVASFARIYRCRATLLRVGLELSLSV